MQLRTASSGIPRGKVRRALMGRCANQARRWPSPERAANLPSVGQSSLESKALKEALVGPVGSSRHARTPTKVASNHEHQRHPNEESRPEIPGAAMQEQMKEQSC